MNLSTKFDWSENKSPGALGSFEGDVYQDLIWEVGAVWGSFVAQISHALAGGGQFDITADQALRLYSLAKGGEGAPLLGTAGNRSVHDTSQLYRNDFLAHSAENGTTVVTARGMAVVSLIDDVLSAQAFAIKDDAPLHQEQLGTIARALKHLSRWIKDAA